MPGCTDSFASASFTVNCETSASCSAKGFVNAAGICSTKSTAPGKSFGNPATTRITAAGPPVDAAITTIGNFPPVWDATDASAPDFLLAGISAGAVGAFPRVAVRTTRTFAAILSLRVSSSRTLRISKSIPLEGLGTKSIAPSSSARKVLEAPSRDSELTMTIGLGCCDMIISVACKPSTCGILMSMVITSGRNGSASGTPAPPPLVASPRHFELRIGVYDLLKHLAHERGVIHYQHSNFLFRALNHFNPAAPAPSALAGPSVSPGQSNLRWSKSTDLPAPAWLRIRKHLLSWRDRDALHLLER